MAARLRRRTASVLALSLLFSAGAAGARRQRPQDTAQTWAAGPVRWLLRPEEAKELRRLRDERAVAAFIEAFWRRRDPGPGAPGQALKTFSERVRAADQLYTDGDRRGSLTPRGRVIVLLGAPPALRYSQRAVPTLEPEREHGQPVLTTRIATLETWIYGPDDLTPALALKLEAAGGEPSLSFVFEVDDDRSKLIEGEEFLDPAAAAWVRQEAEPSP